MTTGQKIKELKEKYKDANIVISVLGAKFNMKDYDLDSIYFYEEHDSFFIKNNQGEEDKELLNCIPEYAEIIS